MDSKFQQSFIPKEPISGGMNFRAGQGLGIFSLIAIVIFLISAGTFGVAYFYKQSVKREIAKMDTDLARTREIFQQATIAEFKKLSNRLSVADKLLNSHTALSRVFNILEETTLKSIYFNSFYLTGADKGFALILKGVAKNFSSAALQSNVFSKNQFIKNPIFSNLNLDLKGNVIFDIAASIDPSFLSYKNNLTPTEQ
ncbi:MAG TPA: hypothetical protein VJC04_03405 [Candidatus Paceibacterota bacterium]